MPRGVCIDKDLRRNDQRLRERVARLGRVHAQIKIFIGVAQPPMHNDHRSFDVRLHFGHVTVDVRGNQRLAKRRFYFQALGRDSFDRAALRGQFIHRDDLPEP